MDASERIHAASKFLLQAPPGEINDVLNDVRNIISDDESLQDGVLPALREYNLAQFTTVEVPGTSHQAIVSEAARLPGEEERFFDPRSKTSFVFDHLTLEAADAQPVEIDADAEPFRAALEKATLDYLTAHFHDGVASVFAVGGASKFFVQIVANKYNPSNYWSGRWRSEYVVNLDENKVDGKVMVNVHYYEQGNVQLSTDHTSSLSLPSAVVTSAPAQSASKILALIEDEEGRYQTSLNDTYHEMGEKTFKGLRRALPMTRQKLDWDKVLGYKLGAELSASKGCAIPPIEDGALIAMITATNENDIDNGLDGWLCRKCRRAAQGLTPSVSSSRASTVVPPAVSLPPPPPPPPPLLPPAAVVPTRADTNTETKPAAVAPIPKQDPSPNVSKYKQTPVQKASSTTLSIPRPRVTESKTMAAFAPPLTPPKPRAAQPNTSRQVLVTKRTLGRAEAMKISPRADESAGVILPEVSATKVIESAKLGPTLVKQASSPVSKKVSPVSSEFPRPLLLARDKIGARKTASKLPAKRARAAIPPASSRHYNVRQPSSESSIVSDSEKEFLPETIKASISTRIGPKTLPAAIPLETVSESTKEARAMSEDIRMSDSEDDLYGPPADLLRNKLSKDLDMSKQETPPSESASRASSPNHIEEATSWMHRTVGGVSGDPWDRLVAKKAAPVPMGRSRIKSKARRLKIETAVPENLANFTKDEWLRAHAVRQ
ncbi:hypothetical protein HWV62_25274 [Athelia sp. TMB]|nr:hypothetical protein HWV62_25274 [Athelia sp. TMB]